MFTTISIRNHAHLKDKNITVTRILVVDDSLTIRAILTEILAKERDLELVGVAASAEEALHALKQCYPDVITIDVAMPGMDGIDLLDHLPRHAGIRTIMLSGHIDAMADAMDHGADAAFDKASILSNPKGFLKLVREVAAGKVSRAAEPEPL